MNTHLSLSSSPVSWPTTACSILQHHGAEDTEKSRIHLTDNEIKQGLPGPTTIVLFKFQPTSVFTNSSKLVIYFTLKASYFRSSEGKRATKRQLRTFHFQRTSKTRCSAYFAHNPTHEYGLASAWSDGRSNSLQPHPCATTCKDAGQSVLMRHQDAASTFCEQQTEGK